MKKLKANRKTVIFQSLTIEDLLIGSYKALKNSESLIRDAEYFIKHRKRHRAMVFAVAAIEEAYKADFLKERAITRIEKKSTQNRLEKQLSEIFRNHKVKLFDWIFLNAAKVYSRAYPNIKLFDIENMSKFYSIAKDFQPYLQYLSKTGLYVEYKFDRFWTPEETFKIHKDFDRRYFRMFFSNTKKAILSRKDWYGKTLKALLKKAIKEYNSNPSEEELEKLAKKELEKIEKTLRRN